jgi:signal transduction histidine kinase
LTPVDLVDRLAAHRTLGSVPREELQWLASHGTLRHLETGGVLTPKNSRVESLFVVLTGRIAIFVDRGAGRHKMMEWREGDVTGVLPYSRLVSPPGDTVAQEPSTVLAIPRDHLSEMIRECHQVTSVLVHTMIDRARAFNASDLHDEKMVSLGKLAAGLAHELNNPAAAIDRSASMLGDQLEVSEQAAADLQALPVNAAQLAVIDEVRAACRASRTAGVRSAIERAEREDALGDWLTEHGVDPAIADDLAETPVTLDALDRLAAAIEGPALGAVLRRTAASCTLRSLTSEIQEAATRISGLVIAIKGFTHMDQAAVAEPVDLAQGLGNTVAVLRSKARGKSAAVVVTVEPGLPRVRGFGGELNQIWANLIDNALDAIPEAGRVELLASREGGRVVVRVVDNGPGIPDDVRQRIFDPFFTTKPMGQGTGLGLDIVRRLVRHNDGEISVESQPGKTEFRVVLHAAGAEGGA